MTLELIDVSDMQIPCSLCSKPAVEAMGFKDDYGAIQIEACACEDHQ
jgi:hypothetical protein